jgi:hypothetical protein
MISPVHETTEKYEHARELMLWKEVELKKKLSAVCFWEMARFLNVLMVFKLRETNCNAFIV